MNKSTAVVLVVALVMMAVTFDSGGAETADLVELG